MTLPIHHRPTLFSVELRTCHWAEMVEWYRHVLGLRVLVRVVDDGYALFEAGDTRVAILSRDSAGEASGRWSLGFEVTDLEAAHVRLREAGAELVEPKTPSGGLPRTGHRRSRWQPTAALRLADRPLDRIRPPCIAGSGAAKVSSRGEVTPNAPRAFADPRASRSWIA